MINVKHINKGDEFHNLKDKWNLLLERSYSNNIFLKWEWLYTWWKHYHHFKELFIITAWDEEENLLGIAPLCISTVKSYRLLKMKVLTFLGTGEACSEYLDFILGPERIEEVVSSIFQYIRSFSKLWDYVLLNNVSESSKTIFYLKNALNSEDNRFLMFPGVVCPFIKLPGSYESFYQGLSKNMRYNLRRRTRNLEKRYNSRFMISNGSSDIEYYMETLFDLHKKRRDMIGSRGDFLKDNLLSFHKEVAQLFNRLGYLRIYNINIDSKTVSILYGFNYNKRYSYYQAGMDPAYEKQSIGMVLMGYSIKDSIENKIDEYDFLRGTEAYKFKWTNNFRKTFDLIFPSPSIKGKSYAYIKTLKQLAKREIKKRSHLKE